MINDKNDVRHLCWEKPWGDIWRSWEHTKRRLFFIYGCVYEIRYMFWGV